MLGMLRLWPLFIVLIFLSTALPSFAQDVFLYDFEQSDDLEAYEYLVFSGIEAVVATGDPDGTGHCMKYSIDLCANARIC